jgi:WD40 repeat protein
MIRTDSLAGQVIAVISRRTPAFQPSFDEPLTFPGQLHRTRLALSKRTMPAAQPAESGTWQPGNISGIDIIEFPPPVWRTTSDSTRTRATPEHFRRPDQQRSHFPRVPAILGITAALAVVIAVVVITAQPFHNQPAPIHNRPAPTSGHGGAALTGALVATLRNPESSARGVAFGPSARTLAVGSVNNNGNASGTGGSTYVWDIATKTITATLTDPGSMGVESVAYGPGGTTLAAADYNGSTYLWDIATKTITATLTDPGSKGVDYVAYGTGGTTLAAADYNGSTYLWDIATKTITATLTDPGSKGVDSVAYAPDGTTLAAADTNGSTYLWDIATKKVTATLTDPESEGVYYVAFAPGGTTLAAADSNGSTYLWRLTRYNP